MRTTLRQGSAGIDGFDHVLSFAQIRWSNVYFGFARLLLLKKR
jgi:hypothetical protein